MATKILAETEHYLLRKDGQKVYLEEQPHGLRRIEFSNIFEFLLWQQEGIRQVALRSIGSMFR